MKKQTMLLPIFFFASVLYAQSGEKSRFIDSPSWVLAGEGKTTAALPLEGEKPPANAAALPAEGTVELKTAAAAEKNASASARTASNAAAGKSTRTSSNAAAEKNASASARTASKAASSKGAKTSLSPHSEGRFHVGVYLTPEVNWLGGLSEPYTRSGVSFSASPTVLLDIRVFRRFYIGAGLSLNTFGGKIAFPDLTDEQTSKPITHNRVYNYTYAEIPVRLKLKTPDFIGGKGSFVFSAGLHTGFGVLYKYKDIYENLRTQLDDMSIEKTGRYVVKGEASADSRLVNLSVVGQIGYNHRIAKHLNLFAGIEYHYGFIQPMKGDIGTILHSTPEFYNHQAGLVIGIMF